MNRRIARSLLMLTIVVLALTASACGSDDPYSGSWSNFRYGPVTIEPANAGWWSITPGRERRRPTASTWTACSRPATAP